MFVNCDINLAIKFKDCQKRKDKEISEGTKKQTLSYLFFSSSSIYFNKYYGKGISIVQNCSSVNPYVLVILMWIPYVWLNIVTILHRCLQYWTRLTFFITFKKVLFYLEGTFWISFPRVWNMKWSRYAFYYRYTLAIEHIWKTKFYDNKNFVYTLLLIFIYSIELPAVSIEMWYFKAYW